MDKGYVQNTIFELLSRLGIGYEKLEHSPIITMKEGSEIAYKLGSTSCKNLFLCNKRQEYFMLMLPADKKLSAKNVARQIGSPHLSFASAEDMERLLHTYPGAVSVLSLIYDKEKRVQLLIDKGLMNVTYIGCHPCTNTCSLKIKMEDILTVWLPATGLKWKDVFVDRGQYRLAVSMQKTKEPIYLPLSPEALKWMPERGDKTAEDHVFDLPSPSMMNLLIKPWAKAAGIDKRFTFHTARHTFATMMLTLGADLYTTSKLLGHADVKMTQVYAKIINQKKDDAVNLVNGLFD